MNALQDRRVIAALGGVIVLLLALLIGVFVLRSHRKDEAPFRPPPAACRSSRDRRTTAPAPASRCAASWAASSSAWRRWATARRRTEVASQALDVGLDPATGAVTNPSGSLAPPPAAPAAPVASSAPSQEADADEGGSQQPAVPAGECLRYNGDGWRAAGTGVTVGQCVRTLYEGRCARPGEAVYGRWGQQTLRLIPGRVEMSGDNRNFHPLMQQGADCSLPSG